MSVREQNNVDFQIEIVPADGIRAAIFRKQRLRNVADLGAALGRNDQR
jgi:hypothetical protein